RRGRRMDLSRSALRRVGHSFPARRSSDLGLAVVGQVVLVEGGGPDGAAAAGAVAVDGGDRGPAGVPRQDGHNRVGPDVEVQVLRVGDARHVSFPFRSPASGACEYYSTRNLRGFRKSLL